MPQQPMTVSGWTTTSALFHPGQNRRSRTQKIRCGQSPGEDEIASASALGVAGEVRGFPGEGHDGSEGEGRRKSDRSQITVHGRA